LEEAAGERALAEEEARLDRKNICGPDASIAFYSFDFSCGVFGPASCASLRVSSFGPHISFALVVHSTSSYSSAASDASCVLQSICRGYGRVDGAAVEDTVDYPRPLVELRQVATTKSCTVYWHAVLCRKCLVKNISQLPAPRSSVAVPHTG
jgi:hypothetical protein